MTEANFLALAQERYAALQALNKITNFYDYEKEFEKIWRELGKEVLESNLSEVPADRRKKKLLTKFGKISINKTHDFSDGANGFQISPHLQELLVYAGQLDCYENCNAILEKFIDIKVSATQVYLITDFYGNAAEKEVNSCRSLEPVKKEEVLYVEADGSMLLTRDEGWKEVKVGRMFTSDSCIDPNGKSSWIRHSQYVAHLGNSKCFTGQMDTLIESYGRLGKRLVFISDGGTWIKNWIEDAFPEAVSILDYYHVCEHLHQFASTVFSDETKKKKWTDKQKEFLLQSKVMKVIANIKKQNCESKEALELINYYTKNACRMNYEAYKNIGAGLIGSGAIESAHRTVVQKRMKLSGQRWSNKGAQNMLNLRVLKMNQQWDKVIGLIKNAA